MGGFELFVEEHVDRVRKRRRKKISVSILDENMRHDQRMIVVLVFR